MGLGSRLAMIGILIGGYQIYQSRANQKYWKQYEDSLFNSESFDADYTDEQLLKVARWDIKNHMDNGTFYVLGEEPQAFLDGDLDGENFYTIEPQHLS